MNREVEVDPQGVFNNITFKRVLGFVQRGQLVGSDTTFGRETSALYPSIHAKLYVSGQMRV